MVYLMVSVDAMHAVNQQASTLRPSVQLGSLGTFPLRFPPLLQPSSALWVSGPMLWHVLCVLQPDSTFICMCCGMANLRDICAQTACRHVVALRMHKLFGCPTFAHSLSCPPASFTCHVACSNCSLSACDSQRPAFDTLQIMNSCLYPN